MLLVTGCAPSIMQKTSLMKTHDSGSAMVTFLRPSFIGSAIQFGLWDSEKLVGTLSASSYVQYLAEPGQHLFLARAENWSYVKADLKAGKQYFIIARTMIGLMKARVALDPILKVDTKQRDKIDGWLEKLSPTAMIPEKKKEYMAPRIDQIKKAMAAFDKGEVKFEILEAGDFK
jgi:hypothetical protein